MFYLKTFFFISLTNCLLFCLDIKIQPQVALNNSALDNVINHNDISFSIPFTIFYEVNKSLSIKHSNRLYSLNHPHLKYLYHTKSRGNKTAINEESYIEYKNKNISFILGRKYVNINNKLMISDFSNSFDQLNFNFNKHNFEFNYYIFKMNNEITTDQNDQIIYISRWLYYRDYIFNINKKTELTISESVIATGENRNIDLYYLTPFGLFLAEQYHNLKRIDGGDSLTLNNDNAFVGLNIKHNINDNLNFNFSILIDDFQIDIEDRDRYQDVFGYKFGIEIVKNKFNLSISYNYASPWLYLNNGTFTNLQQNNFPIGLKYPHYHSLQTNFEYFDEKMNTSFILIASEKGKQDLNTEWEAEMNGPDDYIPFYEFSDRLPIELYMKIEPKNSKKYLPNFILYHNFLNSNNTAFVLEWNLMFNYNMNNN